MMTCHHKQPRVIEAAYRRGYHQAFEIAAQLLAEGYTPAEITRYCRRLAKWRYAMQPGEQVVMTLPPEPRRKRGRA